MACLENNNLIILAAKIKLLNKSFFYLNAEAAVFITFQIIFSWNFDIGTLLSWTSHARAGDEEQLTP